jgi:hypothetical protein
MSDNYIIEVKPPSSGVTFPAGIVVRACRRREQRKAFSP